MQKIAARLFYAGFALLWGWIFVNNILRWPHNGLEALALGLAMAAAVWALAKFVLPKLDNVDSKHWKLLSRGMLIGYTLFLLWMGWLLAEVPIMDHEVILKSLPEFLDYGKFPTWGGYYIVCNNNLGLALLLGSWYKLTSLFGFGPGLDLRGVMPGIVLNVLAIAGAAALICVLARRVFGSNRAVALAFLLTAGFAPFVLYSPCFYSDTLSLPFALLVILGFDEFRKNGSRKKQLLLLAGIAAAAFVGFAVKGSVVVVLVAVLIQLFLEHPPKKALLSAAALVLVFLVLLTGYKAIQRSWLIDWSEEDHLALPLSLWFCYGSHDDGNYSQRDFDLAMTVDNLADRKELIANEIRKNYGAYTPGGLLEFMTRKASITWGDGLYNAEEFLATPQRANWTHKFILEGQPGYMPVVYYCQGYLLMLELLVLLYLISQIKPAVPGTLTLSGISLLGLVLFLSLWETKARYAFNFTPLMILLALGGALWLAQAAVKKEKE